MKKLFGVLLTLVVIAIFVLVGCNGTTEPPNGNEEEPTQKVLKIGSLIYLEDPSGLALANWLELLTDLKNEEGGWLIGGERYWVDFKVYESGNWDPVKTRAAVEKAVLVDGVQFLVDNQGDVPALALLVTEPNKVLYIGGRSGTFQNEQVAPETQYSWRANGVFFGAGSFYIQSVGLVESGASTGVIVKPDTEAGHSQAVQSAGLMEHLGVQVLETVFFAPDTVDFGPVATKIASYNPDLIEMFWCDSLDLLSALKDIGYDGAITGSGLYSFNLPAFRTRLGDEFIEGFKTFIFDPILSPDVQASPEKMELINTYAERYGEEAIEVGAFWLMGWQTFVDAIDATQSIDPDVLKAYLDNSPPASVGLSHSMQLTARPDLGNYRSVEGIHAGYWLCAVEDGELVPYMRLSIKDQYLSSLASYCCIVDGFREAYVEYWHEYGYPTFPDDETSFLDFSIIEQ